jgi:hypothetical protein
MHIVVGRSCRDRVHSGSLCKVHCRSRIIVFVHSINTSWVLCYSRNGIESIFGQILNLLQSIKCDFNSISWIAKDPGSVDRVHKDNDPRSTMHFAQWSTVHTISTRSSHHYVHDLYKITLWSLHPSCTISNNSHRSNLSNRIWPQEKW